MGSQRDHLCEDLPFVSSPGSELLWASCLLSLDRGDSKSLAVKWQALHGKQQSSFLITKTTATDMWCFENSVRWIKSSHGGKHQGLFQNLQWFAWNGGAVMEVFVIRILKELSCWQAPILPHKPCHLWGPPLLSVSWFRKLKPQLYLHRQISCLLSHAGKTEKLRNFSLTSSGRTVNKLINSSIHLCCCCCLCLCLFVWKQNLTV